MPKKTKASPQPSAAQVSRAERLRGLIGNIESGRRPPGAPVPTPREITDEAARKKWEEEQGKE